MRNKTRLLSSLMDLKLRSECGKAGDGETEGRRKNEKYFPIKFTSNETEIYENFTPIQKKKSLVDKTLILKSLASHFTFSSLIKDRTMQEHLLDKFRLCRVNKGDYLMKQNDNASSFFILHEGELYVEIDGQVKRKLESGEGFGELALLYSSPRSASIKANKASFLWYIDRSTFRKAISSMTEKNFHETRQFIEKNPFFMYLTSVQKDQIASIAITQHFVQGTKICKAGEQASSMYIIKSGNIVETKPNEDPKLPAITNQLNPGDFFGEYTMVQKNPKWKGTSVAANNTDVIALASEHIQHVLGKSLPLIATRNRARELLLKHKDTCKLSAHYIDLVIDCFKIQNMKSEEEMGSSKSQIVFFVLEGYYEVKKESDKLTIINSFSDNNKVIYGSFRQENEAPNQVIKFTTPGKVAWANLSEILKSLDCTLKEAQNKSADIENSALQHRNRVHELRNHCSKFSISDFKVLTKLGEGQFGTVFLITDPTKTNLYALKCISKQETVKNKLEKHLLNQKLVLEEMNEQSPFCVNYIRSFKDDNYIYFLMEYINGLELFDVIRIIGILTPEQTQFYGAIMLSILEAMHSRGIIYRDLKPENVMVEENGYLKLIDMGTCKKMSASSPNGEKASNLGKTFTIIGTPNYMAPEIISGKGYSYYVDLWSLGIVLYEFMSGYVPFGEEAQDPYEIYQEILKKPLTYPAYMKNATANSFITQLLSKTPEARLCGSYSSLKKHAFLAKVDWSSLMNKTMEAAFILPKNKLIEVEKYMGKLKTLDSQLAPKQSEAPSLSKASSKKEPNLKWDEGF